MDSTKKKYIGRLAALLVILLPVALVMSFRDTRHRVFDLFSFGAPAVKEGVYFTCPMHPDIRLPQRGDCPICGMSLVEKTEGEEAATGIISVTPQQIQLSGVTVRPLKKRELFKEINAFGKIDYDETKLEVVSAWVGGRINKLYIDFTGVTVNRGHPLVDLYSPDLISTKREYLVALDNLEKIQKGSFEDAIKDARDLVKSTRQRLIWLGLDEKQIDEFTRSRKIEDHIVVNAPQGGTVIHKNAYPGMYVKEGDVLFRIADLSRVWIYADIYEDDIPFLYQPRPGDYYECAMHPDITSKRPGTCSKCGMDLTRANKSVQVEIDTRAFPGELFKGYISFTDPFLNPETRTVRVRVNIDNPNLRLKPDMFAKVRIKLPVGEMLAVPENAVILSGTRKIVLIEEEHGKFRPQPVKLGRMWLGDANREAAETDQLVFQREAVRFHEVIAGLEEDARVVTSGNFLLSSESQLQGALTKMLESDMELEGAPEKMPAPEKTPAPAEKKPAKRMPPLAEEKNMPAILDAYYGIGKKLAGDSREGVAEFAKQIKDQAQNDAIKKAAEPLLHANHKDDIEAVRKDFRILSENLISYVDQHKAHIKKLPHKVYCPMADASWLQNDKQVENPYYGSSMLRCGTIQSWEN